MSKLMFVVARTLRRLLTDTTNFSQPERFRFAFSLSFSDRAIVREGGTDELCPIRRSSSSYPQC